MRRARIASVVVALGAIASIALGCVIITGTDEGYTSAPEPRNCANSNDCEGGVCCVIKGASSITAICQSSCSGALAQLCVKDDECSDAGCGYQICTLGSNTVVTRACGTAPFCAPLGSATAPDAGADAADAGVDAPDAGVDAADTGADAAEGHDGSTDAHGD